MTQSVRREVGAGGGDAVIVERPSLRTPPKEDRQNDELRTGSGSHQVIEVTHRAPRNKLAGKTCGEGRVRHISQAIVILQQRLGDETGGTKLRP